MSNESITQNIKVAVRIRPLNESEVINGTESIIQALKNEIIINYKQDPRSFAYDYIFTASQDELFDTYGKSLIDASVEGFNGCFFAYGQTGCGKSYSVSGTESDPGLVPRCCHYLFNKMSSDTINDYRICISYIEIYNEHIRDLISPEEYHINNLKVFEHPILGVIIPGASICPVENIEVALNVFNFGLSRRSVAATAMNSQSSRSHSVFTLKVEKISNDSSSPSTCCRVNIVDLAGSERISKSGYSLTRERYTINQSLTTLGLVIKDLAQACSSSLNFSSSVFIPFRSSKLTFLLKDSLCGNSKTFMVAAISPSSSEVEETLSTLRFANSVKSIKTLARQNIGSEAISVAKLLAEIKMLKEKLYKTEFPTLDLHDDISIRETLIMGLSGMSFKKQAFDSPLSKYPKSKSIQNNNEINNIDSTFFLVNVSDDPTLSGSLVYPIPKSPTTPTSIGSSNLSKIQLKGLGITETHCSISNEDDSKVILSTSGGRVVVNGKTIVPGHNIILHNNYKITLGKSYQFIVRDHRPSSKSNTDHLPLIQTSRKAPSTSPIVSKYSSLPFGQHLQTLPILPASPIITNQFSILRPQHPKSPSIFSVKSNGSSQSTTVSGYTSESIPSSIISISTPRSSLNYSDCQSSLPHSWKSLQDKEDELLSCIKQLDNHLVESSIKKLSSPNKITISNHSSPIRKIFNSNHILSASLPFSLSSINNKL